LTRNKGQEECYVEEKRRKRKTRRRGNETINDERNERKRK
jgi:hypothetical protein